MRLYQEIQALSGQDIGLHFTGGLNVAATPERWEMLRADHARHRVLGLETQLVGPAQIRELCPLIDVTGVLGALHDPMEGHLDPNGAPTPSPKPRAGTAPRFTGAPKWKH